MKTRSCCESDVVMFMTLVSDDGFGDNSGSQMRPGIVTQCNDDMTVNLAVFTEDDDIMPTHNDEPFHPVCHVINVQYDPNMSPGTWHTKTDMNAKKGQ